MVREQPESVSLEGILESVNAGSRSRRSAVMGTPLVMQDGSVQHSWSRRCMLQAVGDSNKVLYIRGSTDNSSPTVQLGMAQMTPASTEYCLVIHWYGGAAAPGSMGQRGLLVVLEKESTQGLYLFCTAGQNSLHVTTDQSRLSATDDRLFRLLPSSRGGMVKRLQHVATGKFVSHASEQVALVTSSDQAVAIGHLDYTVFPC